MQAMTQKHALESTQVSDSASRKEYVYPCHDARRVHRVHRVVWVWVCAHVHPGFASFHRPHKTECRHMLYPLYIELKPPPQ
jgi:hypothetical protein